MKINRDEPPKPPIKQPNRKNFRNPTNQKKYFKIKRFVEEYMIDLSPYKAWKRCGYAIGSVSLDTADAYRAFQRPDVQQMIFERMQERAKKLEITQEAVLKELALIAFQNIKDIAEWDGSNFDLKPFDQLTREQTAVISEIQISPGVNGVGIKFKTYDKKSALIDVGKHIGMFWEGNGKDIDATEMARKIKGALNEMDRTNGKAK